ncbi:glycoside hydrolase family 61 protein [Apiospora marii]|uniref:lytic cellulose monooxygenase (C4-dehydrogenating) n=1 Tax=Apiospora marii TaxID=335849 RepID=A0ABR1SA80_9PEZI
MRSSHSLLVGFLGTLAATANGHTIFTTMYVDGQDQGDGTCVRMSLSENHPTDPIKGLDSNDMACGVDGGKAVGYTCPVGAGSTITFEWREYANLQEPGSIDISHKGPCAVYIKQVGNMATSTAAGSGWVKIWDEGYDSTTGKWCTEKLIDNQGLLSVRIPTNVPTGNYLVRPELLALQNVQKNDPQFYVGCAQVAIKGSSSGKLDVPAGYSVSIPGHVKAGEPSVSFNIYQPKFPYPLPGPKVWNTQSTAAPVKVPSGDNSWITGAQTVPATCLLTNANWCGVEVPDYTTEEGCWKAHDACSKQTDRCYGTAPPTGSKNCQVWEAKCQGIEDACNSGNFQGPPKKGKKLESADPKLTASIPPPGNVPSGASSGQKEAVVVSTGETATSGTATITKTLSSVAASVPTTTAVPVQGKRGCKSKKARRARAYRNMPVRRHA